MFWTRASRENHSTRLTSTLIVLRTSQWRSDLGVHSTRDYCAVVLVLQFYSVHGLNYIRGCTGSTPSLDFPSWTCEMRSNRECWPIGRNQARFLVIKQTASHSIGHTSISLSNGDSIGCADVACLCDNELVKMELPRFLFSYTPRLKTLQLVLTIT